LFSPSEAVFQGPAKDVFFSVVRPGKPEAQAAFVVTPALKVTVAAGLNVPSASVRVGAVYLIGARQM
jgi:hypothetical protein